jgi:hypothetical protein
MARAARRALLAALAAALPAPATAVAHDDLELLRRHAPVVHLDARDPHVPTAVAALTAGPPRGEAVALRPRRDPLPVVAHGRALAGRDGRTWLQFWLLYADNPQDRGIVRTGRHEGDWELVQVGLDRRGRPVAATYAQHAWAAACAWTGHVFVANGSHASYPVPGVHGRPWPDPDDEARGDGRVARVRVEPFGDWARWPGRWGRSEAAWVPGEQSSPRGPAFQSTGAWRDPSGYHAAARPCAAGAPGHPWWALLAACAAVIGLAAAVLSGARTLVRWRA